MKHLILGAGNLGLDIAACLGDIDHVILSRSRGFRLQDIAESDLLNFDVIWYCVGAGSVAEAKSNVEGCRDIYERLPLKIMARSTSRFVYFSTDYAADESEPSNPAQTSRAPRSAYAAMKIHAEERILETGRPLTSVVRIGSLYGRHKPGVTFPGKLLKNETPTIKLPSNLVTPTSTRWLARTLVANIDLIFDTERPAREHCAPEGSIPVREWGRLILGDRITEDEWIDHERPLVSALGCSFLAERQNWKAIWDEDARHPIRRDG